MRIKKLPTFLTAVFLLCSLGVMAQQREVSGVVTDASDGNPLIGVTMVVKGTTIGAVTTADGSFQLKVPKDADTLVISYVGYSTKKVAITDYMQISLSVAHAALNELVVIGYGTQKKKDLTGAISSIDAKDFQKGTVTSPAQLISGKISGVSVTSGGGQPGGGSVIRIRGITSLNGNQDPLIVIDGVPVSKGGIAGSADPLTLLNPNDIANVTVLKDASAAAIYGSRASAGVILITTKSGKSGRPTIRFNTSLSVAKNVGKIDVLSAKQFRDYVNTNGTSSFKSLMGDANTDWQNEIYRPAITTDNNLTLSGGIHPDGFLESMPYRVSLGYTDQKGTLKTGYMKRFTGSVKVSPTFLDGHLKIDVNANGSHTKSRFANQGAIGSAIRFDPTQPVHGLGNLFGGYWEWPNADTSGPAPLATRNPVALIMQNRNVGYTDRLFGNVKIDYRLHFLPELHAILNLGLDVAKGHGTVHVPADAAQSWASTTNHGSNTQYQQERNNQILEFSLNYVKDLNAINSNINVTAGYGYYNNLTTNHSFPALDSRNATIPGTDPTFLLDKPENTLLSYYGRLIYTYNTKYVLTASVRTDGSSRFAPDVRWGVFPAFAFAWRINEENFLKNSNTISNLKLRLSYGVTGNQEGIGNYTYIPDYGLSNGAAKYQIGNIYYNMATPQPYVADLTWEQTASTNFGLDYGFLEGRITGSLDFYFKKTKNLLDNITIPVGSNFTNKVTTNIGNMTSKGIEFSVNGTAIQQQDFSWDVGLNVAYNKIEITRLRDFVDPSFKGDPVGGISGGTGNNVQIQTVGYTPNAFFVFQQVYDQDGHPIEGVYVDRNNDGKINDDDKYRYKSPFPPVTLGFSTEFNYKKWSLQTTLRSNIGNYMYNNVASDMGVKRSILNPLAFLQNATTEIYHSGFYNNQYHSDYYIHNASFLKMDNLGIGYQAINNDRWNLSLSFHIQNVFTITKYDGLDPEIYGGIDNTIYPRPRTYTLGVNVSFK